MSYKINDKYYYEDDMKKIINEIIIQEKLDNDLLNNFEMMIFNNHIDLLCFSPSFSEKISFKIFEYFSTKLNILGSIAKCGNCICYEEIKSICQWKYHLNMPYWVALEKDRVVDENHKNCGVFILKPKVRSK